MNSAMAGASAGTCVPAAETLAAPTPQHHRQLQHQQFVERQPSPGLFQHLPVRRIVGLGDGLGQLHEFVAVTELGGHPVLNALLPTLQSLPSQTAHSALHQPFSEGVDGHKTPCVQQLVLLVDELILRRLELQLSPVQLYPPAEEDEAVGAEVLHHIGIAEEGDPHVARVVADHCLGALEVAHPPHRLTRLPDDALDGMGLTGAQIADFGDGSVVLVTPGEEIEQVTHRLDIQTLKPGCRA